MKLPEATVNRLKFQHLVIENFISGCSDSELKQEINSGKWSIHQHLAHLASYQPVFLGRMKLIMETFNARFERYAAEQDPEFVLAENMQAAELLSNLYTVRKNINDFLLSLDSGELSRTGFHAVYGKLSILMWAEFFLLHEAHHIYQIFQLVNVLNQEKDGNVD